MPTKNTNDTKCGFPEMTVTLTVTWIKSYILGAVANATKQIGLRQ